MLVGIVYYIFPSKGIDTQFKWNVQKFGWNCVLCITFKGSISSIQMGYMTCWLVLSIIYSLQREYVIHLKGLHNILVGIAYYMFTFKGLYNPFEGTPSISHVFGN